MKRKYRYFNRNKKRQKTKIVSAVLKWNCPHWKHWSNEILHMKMPIYKTQKSIAEKGFPFQKEAKELKYNFFQLLTLSKHFHFVQLKHFIYLFHQSFPWRGRSMMALRPKMIQIELFRIFLTTCHHPNYYFPSVSFFLEVYLFSCAASTSQPT